MLKQIVQFVDKVGEIDWNEESLKDYLKKTKRNFFFAVNPSSQLEYEGFNIVGIDNPFTENSELSKKFVSLEKWMNNNKELIAYTNFEKIRKPIGSNNNAIGGSQALGTKCLSHMEIQNINEEKLSKQAGNSLSEKVLAIFKKKIKQHIKGLDTNSLKPKVNLTDENIEKLGSYYNNFFEELTSFLENEKIFEKILKKDVIFIDQKILGVIQEENLKKKLKKSEKSGICPISEQNTVLDNPKYFSSRSVKKPFIYASKTRPTKDNLLVATQVNNKIHKFLVEILPKLQSPFMLPIDESKQKILAKRLSSIENNFFTTIEEILVNIRKGEEKKFDFYFVDIKQREKINFFDYVSGYKYELGDYYQIFPFQNSENQYPLNRKKLNYIISKLFSQKYLCCLPWVDSMPKSFNTLQKSLYVQLREKFFETIYLGKKVLTKKEIETLCCELIENSLKNEEERIIGSFCQECLNMYINSNLFIIGGDTVTENNLIKIAKDIKEQINNRDFEPKNNESGFYLLGCLLKELAKYSESKQEKAKLLQPITNAQTMNMLKRIIQEKFIEKYSYAIEDEDEIAKKLLNNVLPFIASNNDPDIKELKLWLYAGFFS